MAAGGSGFLHGAGGVSRDASDRVFAARVEALLRYHPEGIGFLDRAGRFIDVNLAGQRMLGYSLEELRGMIYSQVVAPEYQAKAQAAFVQALAGHLVPDFPSQLVCKDGRVIDALLGGGPVTSADGVIEAFGVFRNLSEEVRLKGELTQTHQRVAAAQAELEVIYRTAPAGLLVVDPQGRVVRLNEMLAGLCRLPMAQCLGKPLAEVLKPAVVRRITDCCSWAIEAGQPQLDVEVVQPAGKGLEAARYWVCSFVPLRDQAGDLLGISAAILEVTQAKHAEQRLRDLNARLEDRVRERNAELIAMTAHAVQAEERERRRLSSELHDGAQQLVMLARMRTAGLIAGNTGTPPGQSLHEICELLDQATDGLRSLTFELSPPILYELGLVPALTRLAEVVQQHCGLRMRLEVQGQIDPLDEPMRVALFRACREALMNVAKHAQVKEVSVCVSRRPDQIEMMIRDQGVGFDPASAVYGMGLFGTRERIQQLHGSMQIRSARGDGTTLTLRVPAPAAASSAGADERTRS